MNLLVYPHDLAIGGSQINAIDLAKAASLAGHNVVIYGPPGPLEAYIAQVGLPFIAADRALHRPAPRRSLELLRIARKHKIDLIHAYEWPPCLDAACGPGLFMGLPVLCTVLSMSVSELVPRSVPLIMGTEALADDARKRQTGDVWTIEPPIDVLADNPDIDGREFRRKLGVEENGFLLVTVSRLAIDLKIDALVRAIDATSELAKRHQVRLAIIGDGEARSALTQRANNVNDKHDREVVTLTGPALDPRAAYAAADIVLGMGSSSLRAMSIRRPVIVQGEGGFSMPMTPQTEDYFLHNGFYGVGEGRSGAADLVRQVEGWITSPSKRHEAAAHGRRLVEERFSLSRAALLQLSIYEEILRGSRRLGMFDLIKPLAGAAKLEIRNHDPLARRQRREMTARTLEIVRHGAWPGALTQGASSNNARGAK